MRKIILPVIFASLFVSVFIQTNTALAVAGGNGGGNNNSTQISVTSSVVSGGSVTLSGSASGINGSLSNYTVNVDWGDTATSTTNLTGSSDPYSWSSSHTYTTSGTQSITINLLKNS